MQVKPLYGVSLLALGALLMALPQTGQAQSFFEADASDTIAIATAPSSTFSYTISPGNVTIIPGSMTLSGDGAEIGVGVVNLLNNTPSMPSLTDTVQANSYATGTTGTSSGGHGQAKINVASNPATTITLKNTGKSNLSLHFAWSYDIFVQASSVRNGHDSASVTSTASFAFSDPKNSLSAAQSVSISTSGGVSTPLSQQLSNTLNYTVTLTAGATDTLTMNIGSSGSAQSTPEPGAVAMLIGMGSGFAALLSRRRCSR